MVLITVLFHEFPSFLLVVKSWSDNIGVQQSLTRRLHWYWTTFMKPMLCCLPKRCAHALLCSLVLDRRSCACCSWFIKSSRGKLWSTLNVIHIYVRLIFLKFFSRLVAEVSLLSWMGHFEILARTSSKWLDIFYLRWTSLSDQLIDRNCL